MWGLCSSSVLEDAPCLDDKGPISHGWKYERKTLILSPISKIRAACCEGNFVNLSAGKILNTVQMYEIICKYVIARFIEKRQVSDVDLFEVILKLSC
jgi:hypothetical protein